MKISDFYGTPDQQSIGTGQTAALEVPPEQRNIGGKPVYFWLVLVALLIGARIVYEIAGTE